jgi:ligand-binding sensor domain-containing protein
MAAKILTLLFVLSLHLSAQVGTWKSYTDMKIIRRLAGSSKGLLAATSGGVFEYTRFDDSYIRYTNTDGLASIDVTAIATDGNGTIIAGAGSGMISIREPASGWYAVPDIVRASDKPKKGINILRYVDGRVYIGADFGVAVYNIVKRQFEDTYTKFGDMPSLTKVNDICINGTQIVVATEKGIAYSELTGKNLQDPSAWQTFTQFNSVPVGEVTSVVVLDNTLLAATNNAFYILDGSVWSQALQSMSIESSVVLRKQGRYVYAVMPLVLYRINNGTDFIQIGERTDASGYLPKTFLSDVMDLSDTSIVVASNCGFSFNTPTASRKWSFQQPNGPNSNQFLSMSVDDDGMLWSASGKDNASFGAYSFNGTTWTNYTTTSKPPFPDNSIYSTSPGPNGSMFFATWGGGVIRRTRDGYIQTFNSTNLPDFPGFSTGPNFCPISAATRDSQGNVWFLHYRSDSRGMLSCFTPDSVWRFYKNPFGQDLWTGYNPGEDPRIAIDQFGKKWIVMQDQRVINGLLVFNDNHTPLNILDDTWQKVEVNDPGGLNASSVYCTVVDHLGDVWVGTDKGLRTIFNPITADHITRTCYNTRCNIEGEVINCIAVDPVNNKWIGTANNGVFILSSDGSEILQHFSADNCPLLGNTITSIVIHPRNGIAYIGTQNGLSSLQTEFSQPVETFTTLKITPNPFRPELDQQMTIDGLVEGSTIKIITPSGSRIAEFVSPGGRIAFWNGKTSEGTFAPSGIYFIIAYGIDGTQLTVAKAAVIRK